MGESAGLIGERLARESSSRDTHLTDEGNSNAACKHDGEINSFLSEFSKQLAIFSNHNFGQIVRCFLVCEFLNLLNSEVTLLAQRGPAGVVLDQTLGSIERAEPAGI